MKLRTLGNPLFFKYAKSLFIVTLLIVFYLAFSPKGDPLPDFLFADKLKHAAAFAVLSLLFWGGWRTGAAALFGWMMGIGFFIEAVQNFLPWREASGWDLLADGVGVLAVLCLLRRAALDQS
ncbi:VanZ family protein [Hydrogenimonas sp.]